MSPGGHPMKLFKPPQKPDLAGARHILFLAGGAIDQGAAEDWQAKIVEAMQDRDVTILNPRRTEWDPTWGQSPDNPEFAAQVKWELDGMESADTVVFYFPESAKAPVTLLEFGMHGTPQKGVVFCPPGYWRAGNVQIVAKRRGVPLYTDHDEFVTAIHGLFPAA